MALSRPAGSAVYGPDDALRAGDGRKRVGSANHTGMLSRSATSQNTSRPLPRRMRAQKLPADLRRWLPELHGAGFSGLARTELHGAPLRHPGLGGRDE